MFAAIHQKYNSALAQSIILSAACFATLGIYNALISFATGIADPTIANVGTGIVYGILGLFGFVSAGLVNVIGPKRSVFLGVWGFVLYGFSLLLISQNEIHDVDADGNDNITYPTWVVGFYYISCFLLGACQALLFTALTQILMAYPTKDNKGTYYGMYWNICNVGCVLASFAGFGINYNNASSSASPMMYIVFMILMACGGILALMLCDPEMVVRNDGTYVVVEKLPNWKDEAIAVLRCTFDKKILLLMPVFGYSTWFYAYNAFYVSYLWNARTQPFSVAFSWLASMIATYGWGRFLDSTVFGISRKFKATVALGFWFVSSMAMWGFTLHIQNKYDIDYVEQSRDYLDSSYPELIILYFWYGISDGVAQVYVVWLMGQLTDDMVVSGRYAGLYRAVQSLFATVSWLYTGFSGPIMPLLYFTYAFAFVAVSCTTICTKLYLMNENEEEKALLTPLESGVLESNSVVRKSMDH